MKMLAKPFGALSLVEPKITSKKMKVRATSMNPDVMENLLGETPPHALYLGILPNNCIREID
jgi:hypothetical protein